MKLPLPAPRIALALGALGVVTGVAFAPADTAFCVSARPFRLRGGRPAGGTWSGPGVSGSVAAGFTFTPDALVLGALALTNTGPGVSPSPGPSHQRPQPDDRVDVEPQPGGLERLAVCQFRL